MGGDSTRIRAKTSGQAHLIGGEWPDGTQYPCLVIWSAQTSLKASASLLKLFVQQKFQEKVKLKF